MKRTGKQPGFTIVELLIVIVVIGILATISIVAYTGIQQKARNQQTIAAVGAYAKAMLLYSSDKGSYPIVRSPLSCMGIGYICDGVNNGATSTQALLAELAPYMSSTPQPATSTRVNDRTGALYAQAGANYYFLFIQENQTTCPSIGLLSEHIGPDVSGGHVVCRLKLPLL